MRNSSRPNVRRRVALTGATALMAAAGVGGYLAMRGGSAVHIAPAAVHVNTVAAAGPTTDAPKSNTPETGTNADTGSNVEQDGNFESGDQSGPDTTTPEATTPETGTNAADTGPNVEQDGNFQSGDQSGPDTTGGG